MSFDKIPFRTNPNFCAKLLLENTDCLAGSCNFEVFYSKKNKKTYLVTLNFLVDEEQQKYTLQVRNLEDNNIVKELEGHEDRILNVRYFYNEENEKEYLVSADKKYFVIIWEITDDFKLIKKQNFQFDAFIYSNVLLFKKDCIFLISSSISNRGVKIMNVTKSTQPTEIPSAKDFPVYFMEIWHDKKKNKDFLILCGKSKIKIIEVEPDSENPLNKEFSTSDKQPYNLAGTIYTIGETYFFMSSSTFGGILNINLDKMETVGQFPDFNKSNFYNIVQWNEKYLLFVNSAFKKIEVMGLNDYNIKSQMVFPDFVALRYIKKCIHPVYGECLLAITMDCKLYLLCNRNIVLDK